MFMRSYENEDKILLYEFILKILSEMVEILEIGCLDCKSCFYNNLGMM